MTLPADTSELDTAPFPIDNLNNDFDDEDLNDNEDFYMGDTDFGDQDVLSGKLYVNNQSGDVEGMTITHHGKNLGTCETMWSY